MKVPHFTPLKKQKGAVTLLITLLIMIAMTIGSFAMVNTSTMESRMTINDLHSRQSMQAAQAGIDFVLGHLGQTTINTSALCNKDTWLNNGFLLNFSGPSPSANTGPIVLSFDDIDELENQCQMIPFQLLSQTTVWSRGFSANDESVRTVMSTIDLSRRWNFNYTSNQPISNLSRAPFTTRRNLTIDGNAADIAFCATIADCRTLSDPGRGSVSLGVRQGKTLVKAGGTSDTTSTIREGILDTNNSTLFNMTTDSFFQEYVGEGTITKEEFRRNAVELTPSAINSGGEAPEQSQQIWVNGDIDLRAETFGTPERPVILVVNGNLTLRGNAAIWGLVYVTGNANLGAPIGGGAGGGAGTIRVMGGLVAEGNINMRGQSAIYSNDDLIPAAQGDDTSAVVNTPTLGSQASTSVRIGSWRELTN